MKEAMLVWPLPKPVKYSAGQILSRVVGPGLFSFQRLLSDRSAKFCPVTAKKRPFSALSHPQLLIVSKTLDGG
jgi:hypothetical protein